MIETEGSLIPSIPLWSDEKSCALNVIVETPKGSRNKYDFEPKLGIFKLGAALPLGHTFPFDFGFIPGTVGGDGDPLDVLLLLDEAAFAGCLVESRLIGGLMAHQTEKGKRPVRNDRLIAVSTKSIAYGEITQVRNLNSTLLDQIEHFFISYNEAKGKKFKVERRFGAEAGISIVRAATV